MSTRPSTQGASAPGASASGAVLGRRALNRALLARQLLLQRAALSAEAAMEHLAGLQAQAPNAPYVGLWTRVEGFQHDELARLLTERRAVRMWLMRGTVHLVSARDGLALRPVIQTMAQRNLFSSPFGRRLAGLDIAELLMAARALVEERPRTRAELGALLGQRWPERDAASLAYAANYLLPLVQLPPRGLWGDSGPVALTTIESWLRRALAAETAPDALLLRYLAAFGPASVADMRTWSGLRGLRASVERLRPQLLVFRDEQGRELFDLPAAPRPDPETPAPPRFLPEYDNALLSHADRTRIMDAGRRVPLPPGNGAVYGTVLVDGFFAGAWRITRQRGAATLHVAPFAALPAREHDTVVAEGLRLLAFAAGDAETHDVQVAPPE